MKELSVGFFRFDGYPNMAIGGCAPAPTHYTTHTMGGPETRGQVLEKIAACEKTLAQLRAQLETMP